LSEGRLIDFTVHLAYFTLVSHGRGMGMPACIGPTVLRRRSTLPALLAVSLCCILVPPFPRTPHDEVLPHTWEMKQARPGSGWRAYGCYWNLSDSIFLAQGFLPVAKAYYHARTFRNFTFEVRMAKLAEDGPIGLLFRYNEKRDEGYEIQLWPHGGFAVAKFVGATKKDFASGPPSHFNRELSTWNTVKVVGRGKRFDFFINGFHVCTASDPDHREGKLGLLMPGDARQRAKFQVIKMTEQVTE
jgi:hypothetical protein